MSDKTIQFIDSDYRELFRIPDGGSIKIIYPSGDDRGTLMRKCEFIDPAHTKVGGNIFHICEWAERMEALGARYEPEVQLQSVELKPFVTGDENFFTYNREDGNTCIGHIAGDFGNGGDRFHSNWSDRENGRNTPEFQAELHSAVYALRQNVLKDYDSMLAHCQSHPEATLTIGDDYKIYGFKLETDTRKYFVNCFMGEHMRDSRFIAYAYDKVAPDIVHGYTVKQYVVFDNDRGFALAENPNAPSPFVTWQLTEENGRRDYYWGRYVSKEKTARQDYAARVSQYKTDYGVKEKYNYLAPAEMSKEQNYNMIDGLHNNEAVPRPDLTDGQTHDEIRELAPETLPGDKPSVLERIKEAREAPKPPSKLRDREKKTPELER